MLAQSSSSDDVTVTNVLLVAGFLAFAFALAFVISRIHRFRHRMAWGPVLPLIDGRIEPGPSVNTSVVRGTWRGYPVVCTALPGTPWGPGSDETLKYNRFIVRLFNLSGAGSWRAMHGRQGWQVEADDPALAGRLTAAGVPRMALDLGLPQDPPLAGMTFDARNGHLELSADAGRGPVPPTAELEALLDTMMRIAGINASLNNAPG